MSLHENNTTDEPAMDRATRRLYPSLPNIDSYERCVGGKVPAAAELRPERPQDDTQSVACGADSDPRLKAQILILVEQRKELININDKWAKEYQTMVRFYREKIRHYKASLHQNHSHLEDGRCDEGEKHATLCKKPKLKTADDTKDDKSTRDGVNSEVLKVQKEASELRGLNSTLTRRGQHQQEEIKRLNKALEDALKTTPPQGGSSETLQDLWKHQAEVYREDFLTERKDREKLKEKYLEMENRFRKVHTELRVLKSQVTWTSPPQPGLERAGSNRVKSPNQPLNLQHVHIQRRQLS